MKVGIIGGTGLEGLHLNNEQKDTSWDREYTVGEVSDIPCVFVQRHNGNKPPHLIDHKRTMTIMKKQEVDVVIAISACGSLHSALKPGSFAVPNDFMDFTGTNLTFIDTVRHPQTEEPYNYVLRNLLTDKFEAKPCGAIVSIRGPRFATAAESTFYANAGAQLINMTTGPESSLALELEIPYAVLAFITDYDKGAGMFEPPVSYDDIKSRFAMCVTQLQDALPQVLRELADKVEVRSE